MSKKFFWSEALKAGTIVGLVSVAFALVLNMFDGEEPTFWVKALNFMSVLVTILLLFGFTRKTAYFAPAEEGFSMGKALRFVLASMLFAGIISGLYSAIMANFFIKDELIAIVDSTMAQMQDMVPADQFDATYNSVRTMATNPLALTISAVISNLFTGLLIGIPVGLLVKRQPDIFANPEQ